MIIRKLSPFLPPHSSSSSFFSSFSSPAPSHVVGPSFPPLLDLTLGQRFRQQLERFPHKTLLNVVRPLPLKLTWEEMHLRVQSLCRVLLDMGYQRGDRLGLWMPSRAEWLIAQLATSLIGVVNVSINTAYRPEELKFCLNNVEIKGLIMTADRKTHPKHPHHPDTPQHASQEATQWRPLPDSSKGEYLRMLVELAPEIAEQPPDALRLQALPHLRHVFCVRPYAEYCALPTGVMPFEATQAVSASLASDAAIDLRLAAVSPGDPASIQFTSGTTGLPKGATLTHHGVLNNALLVGQRLRASAEDVLNVCVPQYHCFGQVLGNLVALNYGCELVFADEQFDPRRAAEACLSERCTVSYGVPSMWLGVVDQPAFRLCRSVTKGLVAGSLCPAVLFKRLVEDHGIAGLVNVYGMTETSPVSFASAPDDPQEKRINTVGKVLSHTECKIVDAEGNTLPVGSRGEIWTKGYCVGLGYWGDEAKTKEVIQPGGWMRTGDEGVFDEEGYCTITGRIKDIIIRGGENVYPITIENYLMKHPAILEASVFGVPDAHYGEIVATWIKLRPDHPPMNAKDVLEFCRGKIAHFNIPKIIMFRSEFPQTVSGKIKKHEMRAETMRIFSIPPLSK